MRGVVRFIERIRRFPPIVVDAALGVAILGLDLVELTWFSDGAPLPPPWSILLFAVPCLGLVARRRYVWITYALYEAIALIGLLHVTVGAGWISVLVLSAVVIYSVAERAPGWAAVLAAMSFVLDIWLGDVVLGGAPPLHSLLLDVIYFTPVPILPALAGWSQRRRRKLTAQLEVRAEHVRVEQERLAEQAVARERIQIAHELRSLVSEGVERMTGQARKARRGLETRSAETQQAIGAIELTGRRTLVEMRRLLLVLRRSGPQDPERESDFRPVDEEIGERTMGEIDDRIQGNLPRLRSWLRRPWVLDWCLVLMLSGFMAGEFIEYGPISGNVYVGWLPVVLSIVILSALVLRRRVPFTVLCVIAVAVFLWDLHQGDSPGASEQSLYWATFTVAAYKKPRWAVAAVALAILSWSPITARYRCLCMTHIGALATFAAVAGVAMRAGWMLNRELDRLTDAMLRTRNERVQLALFEERTRVAREMHDLVAHSVTAMVVQAGAARMVAETDPVLAEENLEQIAETGVQAMRELGMLNATLDPASAIPERDGSVDASGVRVLVDRFRRMEQAVHLVEEGEPPPADQGLQISVCRIVQEALTNVRKHARGATTTVRIRYHPDGIEIEVANSAAPNVVAGHLPGAGQGLIGIHERVSVFGGLAETGPTPEGGFRVYAHLPIELVPA